MRYYSHAADDPTPGEVIRFHVPPNPETGGYTGWVRECVAAALVRPRHHHNKQAPTYGDLSALNVRLPRQALASKKITVWVTVLRLAGMTAGQGRATHLKRGQRASGGGGAQDLRGGEHRTDADDRLTSDQSRRCAATGRNRNLELVLDRVLRS